MIRRAVTGVENGFERYTIANDFTSPLRRRLSTVSHTASDDAQPRALLPVIRNDNTIAFRTGQQFGLTNGPAVTRLLALALVLLLCGCGMPESSPEAPATVTAHQTVDAAYGLISTGRVEQTPTPAATPVPGPTCDGAIWWYDASDHVGAQMTVQGRVVHVHADASNPGHTLRIDLGQSFPDPTGLPVFVPSDRPADTADADWAGKMVCARGLIGSRGGATILQLDNTDALDVQR